MSQLPPMHAFLVGNGSYENEDEFPTLDYAPNDAERLFRLLTTSDTAIFDRDTSCWSRDLTLRELEDKVADFFEPVERSHLVLFYFAGHARVVPSGKRLFLIMRDSTPSSLARSAFTIDRLIAYFEEKRLSRYIVILDCCYAQKALNSPDVRARGLHPDLAPPDWCGQGKVFVAAAGEFQLAHEVDGLKHGVFSFYFAKGIETGEAADPMRRWINVLDLSSYVRTQIALKHADINQEPTVSGEDMAGELIIARNLRFQHTEAYQAEIIEYIKRSLNLTDLSDRDKVEAARILKPRKFMDSLKEKVKEGFRQLQTEVVDYGQALGLVEEAIKREFEACVAALAFDASVPTKDLAATSSGHGRALLFSAAHGMQASESDELRSGLFSYYFREALLGKASNADGVVTLSNCFRYLQDYVRGYEHFAQQPVLVANISRDPALTGKGIDWAETPGRRVALLVGLNEYISHEIPPLAYAESDVQALADILQKLGGFECRVILGTHATEKAVLGAVLGVLAQLSKDDLFLFYFTGHGFSTETDGCAVLYDSNYRESERALRVTTLTKAIAGSATGTSLVVLDTCMAPAEMSELR